jgi:hypothetical protein
MSRLLNHALLAALLATALPTAHAQRSFVAGGVGAVNCGEYLKARESRQDVGEAVRWVWGYVSGYNQWSTYPQINVFPADSTVIAYLDKHCRDNPLDSVLQATMAMIADMGGFRPPLRKKP